MNPDEAYYMGYCAAQDAGNEDLEIAERILERSWQEQADLEERYEKLEQVARDMFLRINDPLEFVDRTGDKYMRDGHYQWTDIFREQLEELGVNLHEDK